MGLAAACLLLGIALVVGCNIPEIRFTLHDHRSPHPLVGAACYLASTGLAYALAFWILTISLLGLSEFAAVFLHF